MCTFPETEFKEINSHVRTVFKIVIAWYTFFMSVQVAALAWVLHFTYLTKEKIYFGILIIYLLFYLIQNTIALCSCNLGRRFFMSTNEKIQKIFNNQKRYESPYSKHYEDAIGLMQFSIVVVIVFDLAMFLYATGAVTPNN